MSSTDPEAVIGLYRKYDVRRLRDPDGKHRHCEYFVLDLDHDRYALPLVAEYAKQCREEFPMLAKDLRRKSLPHAALSTVAYQNGFIQGVLVGALITFVSAIVSVALIVRMLSDNAVLG